MRIMLNAWPMKATQDPSFELELAARSLALHALVDVRTARRALQNGLGAVRRMVAIRLSQAARDLKISIPFAKEAA
jgi:hypothetical protein